MNRLAIEVVRKIVGVVNLLQRLADHLILKGHIERTAHYAIVYDNRIVKITILQGFIQSPDKLVYVAIERELAAVGHRLVLHRPARYDIVEIHVVKHDPLTDKLNAMLIHTICIRYAACGDLLDEIPLSVEGGKYLVRPNLVQAFMISEIGRDSRRAAHTLGRELKVMNDNLISYGWERYVSVDI